VTGTETDRGRLLFVALVVTTTFVLVGGTIVGAVAPGASVGGGGADADTGAHANPDTVEGGSSLSALERQMADRLAQRARSGSLNISRDQVGEARESLNGSEYDELLNRYSDVANQTGDFEKTMVFRAVRRDQLNLTASVDEYWTTYEQYEALQDRTAVAEPTSQITVGASHRTELRRLARELESEWSLVETNHTALIRSQQNLSNITDENATRSLEGVNQSVREVNATQQQVRDRHLTETNLTAQTYDPWISFQDPLIVRGQLMRAGGTPIASQAVRFEIGGQLVDTRTDERGRFALSYRPTTIPLDTSQLTVRYVPDRNTTLLGSERTLTVTVEQVEPTVDVSVSPSRGEYSESVTVAGRIGEDGGGAANVSYLVTVAGQVLGSGTTGSDGRFVTNVTLPASIDDGEQTVRVVLPLEERALASTNGSTTMSVVETRTNLTTAVTHVDGKTIRIRGNFTTVDGVAIGGERVRAVAGGTTIGSTTTGPNGTYEATLVVPGSAVQSGPFDATATVGIGVQYDGGATNLGNTAAEGSVSLPTTPVGFLLVGGLAVLLVVGGAVVAWRRLGGWERVLGGVEDEATVPERTLLEQDGHDSDHSATELFDVAREHANKGREDAAVRVGYVALRLRLTEDVEATAAIQTPWEFYRACCESGVDDEVLAVLREMTEHYERVRFTEEWSADGNAGTILDRLTERSDYEVPSSSGTDSV